MDLLSIIGTIASIIGIFNFLRDDILLFKKIKQVMYDITIPYLKKRILAQN